jgi:integrase
MTPGEVQALRKPGRYAVGGVAGLILVVTASGARSWVLRVRMGGRRREFGLGSYPTITLSQARQRAREHLDAIWRGDDPAELNRLRREAMQPKRTAITFQVAAEQRHEAKAGEFRSKRDADEWLRSLQRHIIPALGGVPVDEIDANMIRAALLPIWDTKPSTGERMRQRIKSVLDYAATAGHRSRENPAEWRGNLEHLLSHHRNVQRRHHKAIPWAEIPAFMAKLRGSDNIACTAIAFIIVTAARAGEVREARWPEIDLEAATWTIPAKRMKGGKEHIVPLSSAALSILPSRNRGSSLVFLGTRGAAINNSLLKQHMARTGSDATVHGFRSSFKDWARANSSMADEVSELCLAHVNDASTRAAYARDGLLDQRAELLEQWGDFVMSKCPEWAENCCQ